MAILSTTVWKQHPRPQRNLNFALCPGGRDSDRVEMQPETPQTHRDGVTRALTRPAP